MPRGELPALKGKLDYVIFDRPPNFENLQKGDPISCHDRHQLRGSAMQAGVSTFRIRAQTGHASDAMLARYVRDGELFVDNAASALL